MWFRSFNIRRGNAGGHWSRWMLYEGAELGSSTLHSMMMRLHRDLAQWSWAASACTYSFCFQVRFLTSVSSVCHCAHFLLHTLNLENDWLVLCLIRHSWDFILSQECYFAILAFAYIQTFGYHTLIIFKLLHAKKSLLTSQQSNKVTQKLREISQDLHKINCIKQLPFFWINSKNRISFHDSFTTPTANLIINLQSLHSSSSLTSISIFISIYPSIHPSVMAYYMWIIA